MSILMTIDEEAQSTEQWIAQYNSGMNLLLFILQVDFSAPLGHDAATRTARHEPGLLPAFRMILLLQLLVTLVGGVAIAWRRQEAPLPILFSCGTLLLLIGYLSWARLQQKLGELFLPLALAVAIALPLLDRLIFFQTWMVRNQQLFPEEMLNAVGWRSAVLLLAPIALIAWQYDFRRLLLVNGAIVLLDWSLLTGFWGLRHPYYLSIVGIVLGEGITFWVVGYMVSRMMAAQRRQRQALTEANRHLTHYAAAIEQLATSRERNRLARELHDTLAHTLSALAVQLEAVDAAWEETPAEARTLLVKSLALTRSGLTEARRSLQALRASPLEDLGLALAVRMLAESTAARIGATLTLDLPDVVENLPPDVEQGVYRIAQEALSNVTKHAAARRLTVVLQQDNGVTDLAITDDGQGFALSAAPTEAGYGLRGMQERAALMGATFQVTSAPGKGTTVMVCVQGGIQNGGVL